MLCMLYNMPVMKKLICILCAMEGEAKPILDKAEVRNSEKHGFATLSSCAYKGHEFFVARCGVGKVFSASGLSAIITAHPEIDAYINVGIGGSLDPNKANLLDAVIGKGFVQHDYDTSAFGDPIGFIWGIDIIEIPADKELVNLVSNASKKTGLSVYEGIIASGDTFVADEEKKQGFVEKFDAISCDMEAAAYAAVAYVHKKPFTALRIVSDAVDHQNEYLKYKEKAAELGSEVALNAIAFDI